MDPLRHPDPNGNLFDEHFANNLRRIKLAADVVAEVHRGLLEPLDPESQADLLLATEDLADTTLDLLIAVRSVVWNESLAQDPDRAS
jgi:hypothetical protein